jgi:peptidoglycan hydrolase-like protein with peptidoglycan-binding domain
LGPGHEPTELTDDRLADGAAATATRGSDAEADRRLETVVVSRRRRRWPWVIAVLLVAGIAAIWVLSRTGEAEVEDDAAPVKATDTVVRTDLVEVTDYAGTLGRVAGDPITSSLTGTLTSAAAAGDVIDQGDVLFAIDGEPVVFALGSTPAYRPMAPSSGTVDVVAQSSGVVTNHAQVGEVVTAGDVVYSLGDVPTVVLRGDLPAWRMLREGVDEGADVRQLEQALVDLGYDPDGSVTIDEEFTGLTEAMVERWQDDIGVEDDGVVDFGEVVFMPADVEVRAVAVSVGQNAVAGQTIAQLGDGEPMEGADIEQLEHLLADLGHDPGEVDGSYTASTREAVVAWQEAAGVEPDGLVGLGEVVFLVEPVRISERLVTVGATVAAGSPVLSATGSEIRVTMELPAEDQGLIGAGDPVQIELPDATITPGTVETVDTVATLSQAGEAVFDVTIVLDDPDAAGGLDEAPVDVEIVTDQVDDVLAVPVTALLALAEGGYAVEVVGSDGATRLVAVDPGFYADGLVEIDADGVAEGDEVVVP